MNPIVLLTRGERLFFFFILVLNLASFVTYGLDKAFAKAGSKRISEAVLLGLALVGGYGALSGMVFFRHKTSHNLFAFGVPILALINLIALVFLYAAIFTIAFS